MRSKGITKGILFFLLVLTITISPEASCFAKELFVSTTGDDSVTYDNNDINNPWLTPQRAWYSARAGDTIYFRAGTYTIVSQINTRFNGNDGTAVLPITFKNYASENVIFSSSLSAVFEIEKSYNHVEGITFNGGCIWFNIGTDTTTPGFEIRNCSANITTGGDNAAFVRLGQRAPDSLVEKCTITGPGLRSEGVHQNTSCIFIGRAESVKVLNNELSNAPIGIYFKHANTLAPCSNEIAYNYIHNTDRYSIFTNSNYTNIHDNLIGENNAQFRVNESNGLPGGDYNTIEHNTLYNTFIYLSEDDDGAHHNTVKDNIVMGKCEYHKYGSTALYLSSDYNLYVSGNIVRHNSTDYTLATFSTLLGGCTGVDNDCNSMSGSPTFVGGGTPSSISDFMLAGGSLGENAASDGRDMGADISLVGVQTGVPSAGSPPNRPLVDCVEIVQENFGPEVIFHDEFEDSTLMSERYTESGGCVVTNSVGFGGSSKSVQGSWQVGQVAAGGFTYMFGRNPCGSESNSGTDFREIYWRFYMKTSKGWTGNPQKLSRATILASSNWSQAMIAHLWGEANDLLLEIDPATGIDSSSNLITTSYNDFSNLTWLGKRQGSTPIYDTSKSNAWHCIEAHVKLNAPGNSDGVFEFWMDGNLEARRDDLNWVGSWQAYGINTIMFANYWNVGAPRAQERFIDNIVISTERIGLSPSPVNPVIYKTAFEDPDFGDTQSVFQAQVSSTPDGTGIVWAGEISGSADSLQVDTSTGSFQGSLSGQSSLAYGTYYVRVRHADASDNYSIWSPWKIFTTAQAQNPQPRPSARTLQLR